MAKTKSGLVANDINNVYVSNNGTNWDSVNTPNIPKYPKLGSGIGSLATNGDTIYISYHYSTPIAPFFTLISDTRKTIVTLGTNY